MKMRAAVFAMCFLLGTAAGTRSPVERVVNLLKDLESKVLMDGKREQQTYDKYACWCSKTTDRKAKAIEQAQEDLRSLGQTILKTKGAIATFAAEIAELVEKIKKNKEAQAEATSLREKENAAYQSETDELKQALAATVKAVLVLKKGTKPDSFLQQDSGVAAAAVSTIINALPPSANLKPEQMSVLMQFTAGGNDKAKYAPQSETVQGILRDMYENFAVDLETATLDEATANRDYELFMHVKWEELQAMEKLKAKKEKEKAEAEALLADSQQNFEDTEKQMKADIVFFDATKEACQEKHGQWTERDSLRTEELEGIQKALEVLTTDEARELFGKSIKAGKEVRADDSYKTGVDITSPVLLQIGLDADLAAPVAGAYKVLKSAASRANSLRLAAIAVQVHEAKVGHFDAVLTAIDDMIAELGDEDLEDIQKRDQCNDQYQEVAQRVANITWLIQVNEATIDKLIRIIEKRQIELDETIEQIADVRKYMSDITSQRKIENAEFLNAKKDDTDAINLIVEAREYLAEYYNNKTSAGGKVELGPIQAGIKDNSGTAFLQKGRRNSSMPDKFTDRSGPAFEISEDQAPDADFSHKGHRGKEAKGILSIMTMIIEDVNEEIMNAMRDEEAAQLTYEKQMKAAKKLEEDLLAKKVNLEAMIAKRKQEKADEIIDMGNNKIDLQEEVDWKTKITPDCDWIIGAWANRASDRTAEREGLTQAKAYLAGYQDKAEAGLLQKASAPRKFTNNAFGFKQ